jgi:hypothetical protein
MTGHVIAYSVLATRSNDLTRSFVRLSNLPTYPLNRLSRYEATLWRQACEVSHAAMSQVTQLV